MIKYSQAILNQLIKLQCLIKRELNKIGNLTPVLQYIQSLFPKPVKPTSNLSSMIISLFYGANTIKSFLELLYFEFISYTSNFKLVNIMHRFDSFVLEGSYGSML